MKKKILIVAVFAVLGIFSCGKAEDDKKEKSDILCTLSGYALGDSKIYDDMIVTNNSGSLAFFNQKGEVLKEYKEIPANWIYTYPEDGIIIAGNVNKEIRKIQIDRKWNVISDEQLFSSDHLLIDPTIIKLENGEFILTYVEIEGAVNNSDPEQENGFYTVKSYKSGDLDNWSPMADIVSEKANIEDGDMFVSGDVLYYAYEKEVLDKGLSSLCIKQSRDNGETWSDEKTLISEKADNEMAGIVSEKKEFILYYSSDYDNPGTSYNGGKIFKARFDKEFNLIEEYIPVNIPEDGGILLYDFEIKDGKTSYLYSRNYLTENDIVLMESTIK